VLISSKTLGQWVQAKVSQGEQDNPQLRNTIQCELHAKPLFGREALQRGLQKPPGVAAALAQL
jgi:hypothetical protein